MQILSLPVILLSLLCLIPWTVVSGMAVFGDWLSLRSQRRNPRPGNVAVEPFEPVPESLQAGHAWLLEPGFEPLCIAENPGRARQTREWLYHHPEAPIVLASLSDDGSGKPIVEFATRFEDLSIVTVYGGSDNINIDTPTLIINTVETGVQPALEYHQHVVESRFNDYGDALALNTPEAYQSWINDFDVLYRENSYFVRARKWQQFAVILAAIASAAGIIGLYLMHSAMLADWQALVLAVVIAAIVALEIRWILRPPWEGLSVEARSGRRSVG